MDASRLESWRASMLSEIAEMEKQLTDEYAGKWTECNIDNGLSYFCRTMFRTAFKIETIRFIAAKQTSDEFMRSLFIVGKDELGVRRTCTTTLDNLITFDSAEACRLYQELHKRK